MEETQIEETKVEEKEEAAVTTPLMDQFMHYWSILAIGAFSVYALFSGMVSDVAAQTELNINTEQIVGGFFDGANLVLGLGGLIAVLALPYGIQFAFNFIQGIFSKFSTIRFGG